MTPFDDETSERGLFAARARALPRDEALDVGDVFARVRQRSQTPTPRSSRLAGRLGAALAAIAACFAVVHALPVHGDATHDLEPQPAPVAIVEPTIGKDDLSPRLACGLSAPLSSAESEAVAATWIEANTSQESNFSEALFSASTVTAPRCEGAPRE
jgi:hypothetical protein